MDANTIVTLIQTIGFPIVCVMCLAWYVKYIMDENQKTVRDMIAHHKEEVDGLLLRQKEEGDKFSMAIANNTLAINSLAEYIKARDLKE